MASNGESAHPAEVSRSWLRRVSAAFQRHIRYRITRSGYLFACALLLVGIAAVASANNLLFLILAAMLATLMISGFVSRLCLAGLALELVLPEHISARQPVTARLRLRNVKWFPSFAIQLSAKAGSQGRILQRDIAFPTVPGRTTLEATAPAEFAHRGLHRENLFVVSTRFPFGFVERRAPVSIRSEVVIYPSLAGTSEANEILDGLRGELEREQRGLGADFYRIRPYEFQESARHVDWKSSAHTREIQVREFAREERATVYLFLDLRSPGGAEFERMVESCAYLAWKLSGESARVRLRTQTHDLIFPDQVDICEILRVLAMAASFPKAGVPDPDEDDPHLLLTGDPASFLNAGWRPARVV